ncbi:MAG: hypothetical protein E6I94_09345, partial [Chloroflexi bacterium]
MATPRGRGPRDPRRGRGVPILGAGLVVVAAAVVGLVAIVGTLGISLTGGGPASAGSAAVGASVGPTGPGDLTSATDEAASGPGTSPSGSSSASPASSPPASGPPGIVLREGCDAGTNPIPAANRLMANEYRLTPKPTVRLPANPTWRENPFHDNLWQFHYHSLVYVLQLEGAWARTGENRYLDRAVFLLRDWLRDNPRSNPPSPFSWNDHSTAWRAAVLACTAEIVPVSTWLRQALLLHGSTLADPAFYRRHGNHALNQSIALLDVGHVLNRTDWMQLASARINALIEESVDVQGVTNEQSIGYQLYNYRRYLSAEDRLHACGQPISRAFARVAKMPTFLGWATLPNGEYELIGDTSAAVATSIPGTLAEFAATAGTSGPPPAADFMAYDAGYAFGRTGWGAARPFAD